MERRVWLRVFGRDLFANTYIALVGPPGAGKGVIPEAERFIRSVPDAFVAPSATSPAALVDTLNEAKRIITRPGKTPPYIEYNYVTAIAEELGVLLPAYDPLFLNVLQRLWDGNYLEERKRSKGIHIKVQNPQLSILAGTTPSYLNTLMPDGAWDQGFTSRTIFVFSSLPQILDPFINETQSEELEALARDLIHDIKLISEMFGRMRFTEPAARMFSDWHMAGGPPIPEHSKMAHYIARRSQHLFKLCMIHSVSRGASLEITKEDFEESRQWLLEAEGLMPDIFRATSAAVGDAGVMEDALAAMTHNYVQNGAATPEYMLIRFIAARVKSYQVRPIFENMQATNMIKCIEVKERGMSMWLPVPKAARDDKTRTNKAD